MAYCEQDDLLDKDIVLGSDSTLREKWVERAAEEMDSKLGFLYTVPIAPRAPLTELARHERLLLKSINARLATGRMLLSLHQNDEDTRLHAYAWSLVRSAENDLIALANGDARLETAVLAPGTSTDNRNKVPAVIVHDDESLLDGFENTVMRGIPWYSRPGSL